jgi:hypothetical protein
MVGQHPRHVQIFHEGFLILSQIALLQERLDHSQTMETL